MLSQIVIQLRLVSSTNTQNLGSTLRKLIRLLIVI